MTIDLNGKTVQYGTVNNNAAFYAESGILTIKDTSADETGTIKVTKTATNQMAPPRGAWANTGATVKFVSGNIDAPVGIYSSAASTVIVTGGNITAQRAAVVAAGSSDGTIAKAYISGGTLAGEEYGVQANGYCLVNISGGDISGNIGAGVTTGASTLNITGGNIAGVENGVKLDGKGINKDVAISGGKITAAQGNDALYSYRDTFNLTVSGGEFSSVVPEKYCADGFEPVTVPNTDGLYEVARKMVAEVNGVQYTSVQEAVNAANAGDTVTLISDEALQASVKIQKDLTIDLNGNTLTYKTVNNNGALYADGINLTVVDSSDPSTGLIKTVKEGDAMMTPSGIWANNGATVNFESGSIDAPNGIHVGNGDSVANVSGGTITAEKSALYVSGWKTQGDAHATVTGGKLIGGEYGVNVNGYCDVTIEGGEISGEYGVGVTSGKSDLTITGGTINGTVNGVYLNNTGALVPGTKNVEITGGVITAENGDALYSPSDNFIIAVSGGEFSSLVPANFCAEGYIPDTQPDENNMYTVKHAEIAYTASLNLKDSIDINFYINNLPADSYNEYTVTYTYLGEVTTEHCYNADESKFVVAHCTSREMNTPVTIVVKDPDGNVIKELDYSVKKYCENMLKSENASDKLKALCKAVEIYGAEAQKYFGSDTEQVIGDSAYSIEALPAVPDTYQAVSDGTCNSVKKLEAALNLVSKTELNFYITPNDGVDVNSLTVSVDGSAITTETSGAVTMSEQSDGSLKVTITGITSIDMNTSHTLTVSDGITTKSVIYSPLSWAYRNQGVENRTGISKALWHYYQTSSALFNPGNEG